MSNDISRRRFLHSTAAASAVLAAAQLAAGQTQPATATAPSTKPKPKPLVTDEEAKANSKLRVACIGVGGRGMNDMDAVAETGATIAAICDVDSEALEAAAKKHPNAKKYVDFREIFNNPGEIDAVTVGTPDHTHAPAAMMALKHGKHVYCEKPLTHNIYEARMLRQAARKAGVATQMGNQGHSSEGSRRQVEYIWAGAIGKVKEVHVWTNRPIWPQGMHRPKDSEPVPPELAWNLWLGPAPYRPFYHGKGSGKKDRGIYHPFNWRGWWDFGTGALGDMACHLMDAPYWALKLEDPIAVEAFSDGCTEEAAPNWSIIRYEFPERENRPACKLFWYDGDLLPPTKFFGKKTTGRDGGIIYVGEKGNLIASLNEAPEFTGDTPQGFEPPPATIPRVRGHHLQWVVACLTDGHTAGNFEYAGPLTEMVLLGNLAIRTGKRVEWDVENMRCTNLPEANKYVRRKYRSGWEL